MSVHRAFDGLLLGLNAILIVAVLLLFAHGAMGALVGEWRGALLGDAFQWLAVVLLAANTLTSAVGIACVLFTSQVRELRITWILAFVFALGAFCNVVLVPLFRYYALRRPSRPASLAPGTEVASV